MKWRETAVKIGRWGGGGGRETVAAERWRLVVVRVRSGFESLLHMVFVRPQISLSLCKISFRLENGNWERDDG